MKNSKVQFLLLSILILGCSEIPNLNKPSNSRNQDLLFKAIESTYSYMELNNGARIPDTLVFYDKSYLTGCHFYGLENFSFYYGFIDTISFPNLKLSSKHLPYFKCIQESLNDTLKLSKKSIKVNDKIIPVKYQSKHDVFNTTIKSISSLSNCSNGDYFLGIMAGGHTHKSYLKLIGNKFKCDTIIRYNDGSSLYPCSIPDTLRHYNFSKINE